MRAAIECGLRVIERREVEEWWDLFFGRSNCWTARVRGRAVNAVVYILVAILDLLLPTIAMAVCKTCIGMVLVPSVADFRATP